ncbi:MAG TPA: PfkB family carbohydrate kinase [Candidatus Limnocylindrales bacterium]|jgi:sugar/nucleoside kinase (ribokinase family)|nr:PfkB family carbohydrate kinase [Candidatus Limnocylindrales bacterium]
MSISALCIGHASFDLCMVVSSFPTENSKSETNLLIESGGGPAANAAWLLARWGVSTALACTLGDDEYGRRALKELREAGVDCRLIQQLSNQRTPLSFIISSRGTASRTIINRKVPGPPLKLTPDKLAELDPKLLLFDGHEPEASLRAIDAFPNAITVLDAGSLREGTQLLAGRVQYLVSSERFAAQVTGDKDIIHNWQTCLPRLRRSNNRVIVVTLGEQGLIYDDGNSQERLPALPVPAKDTSAAGDVFHGAFAFALLQNLPLPQALRLATTAAGLSVQKFGGRPSTPDLAEVKKAMRDE